MGVRLLKSEVEEIAKLLNDSIIFVGAVAILAYLGWRYRATQDIDIALISLEPNDLLKLGFRKFKGFFYTPSGFKVDVYTRDVNGIPIEVLKEGVRRIGVGKVRIQVPRLEDLILTKMTGRARDEEDIMELLRIHELDWEYLEMRFPNAIPRLKELKRQIDRDRMLHHDAL